MDAQSIAGDGRQVCEQCGIVAPLADLDMQYTFGDVSIECRDGAACKARRDAPVPNRPIDDVVDALADLGISANADDDLNEDDDICGLSIDPQHLADSDATGMHVGWDADNGWTFSTWCDPPGGGGGPCHLDLDKSAGPNEVAAQVKAILDGTVDTFRAVCLCWGGQPASECRVHQSEYLEHLRTIGVIR